MHARFDYDAYRHVAKFFPDRCAALGKRATMHLVRDGLSQARGYGFLSQYDLLRFLNLMFTFGSGFEYQEEHSWAVPHLADTSRAPTVRMDLLMEEACHLLYPDLYPSDDDPEFGPEPKPADDDLGEEPAGFDVLVWNEPPSDPNYVPQSIEPEYSPVRRAAPLGSVPATFETDDDDLPSLTEDEWELELQHE
jgi:hypothetical protein